ncbi:MAG: beta-ketoacyl-ACP synthase II [Candidatus Omnitrophota bacterium]
MKKRRVVITAVGVVSSIGIGKDDFWKANLAGKSGVSAITHFDPSLLGSKVSGQIRNFNPEDYMDRDTAKKADRFVHLGLAASKLAFDDWKGDLDKEDRVRIGVIYGSGLGGVLFHEEQMIRAYDKGSHRLHPLCVPRVSPNAVASQIAIYFKLLGPNMVISNACASGTNGIGEAYRKIQSGDADMVVTGGAEAPLTEFTFGAYDAMRALSKHNAEPEKASRPFDAQRDGFVLGEGAATLVLEDLEHAQKRGSHIYAEITGYFSNSGAYHMAIPEPTASDISRAMAGAIKDAGLTIKDIDYINAHGTSTTLNDKVETKGIKDVFGETARKIPISSTKSMVGHSIGAAGAIEAVACCLAIEDQIAPPTINYENPDPECDLDYVPCQPRQVKIKNILSNSFGFGSNNACLIFSKFKD